MEEMLEILRVERGTSNDELVLSESLALMMVGDIQLDASIADQITREAFEGVFSSSSKKSSAHVLNKWLESTITSKNPPISSTAAWHLVLLKVVQVCSKLSVKKTKWFTNHCLHYALSSTHIGAEDSWVSYLMLEHPYLLLGNASDSEASDLKHQGSTKSAWIVHRSPSSSERCSDSDVCDLTRSLVELLRPLNNGSRFLSLWAQTWCDAGRSPVPWCYAWPLFQSYLTTSNDLALEFEAVHGDFVERLVTVTFIPPPDLMVAPSQLRKLSQLLELSLCVGTSRGSRIFRSVVSTAFVPALESYPGLRGMLSSVISSQLTCCGQEPGGVERVLTTIKMVMSEESKSASAYTLITNTILDHRVLAAFSAILAKGSEDEAILVLDVLLMIDGCDWKTIAPVQHRSLIANIIESMFKRRRSVGRKASQLMAEFMANDAPNAQEAVECVIRTCTNYCCGCTSEKFVAARIREVSVEVADLLCVAFSRSQSCKTTLMPFLLERLGSHEDKWNFFLFKLLERLLQMGLAKDAIEAVRFIVLPFAPDSSGETDIISQLRLLQDLCHALQSSDCRDDSWRFAATVVSSSHIRSKLTDILTYSASDAEAALAASVRVCSDVVAQNLREIM
ncbi:hypothetical protein PINS_up013137 [Pythium insidiosum]|nr:hypothetical protein PINS_up013137 [Pythium insidiosum]